MVIGVAGRSCTHACRAYIAMTMDQSKGSREARLRRTEAIQRAAGVMSRSFTTIPSELKRLRPTLVQYHFQTINRKARRPRAAELLVARDLRRSIFVAIGHRLALTIAQRTIGVLHGAWMPHTATDPLPETVDDELVGARARRFVG